MAAVDQLSPILGKRVGILHVEDPMGRPVELDINAGSHPALNTFTVHVPVV